LTVSKQRADQLTGVCDEWTLSLATAHEQLRFAEASLAEENTKLQLVVQMLLDSRELYAERLESRGREVQELVEEQRILMRSMNSQQVAKEFRRRTLHKRRDRLAKNISRLKDLNQQSVAARYATYRKYLLLSTKRHSQMVKAMKTNNTDDIIEKFTQTTMQNEGLKRKVSSSQLIILNEENLTLNDEYNRVLAEIEAARMPGTLELLSSHLRNKQEILFKKPEKRMRALRSKTKTKVTRTQINYSVTAESLLSCLFEGISSFLKKIEAVDVHGVLGPTVLLTSDDLHSSAIELVLLFSKKLVAAKAIVDQSKQAGKFSGWKYNLQPMSTKVTLMDRFTDAFFETFQSGVSAKNIKEIKDRIYTTHFLESKPEMTNFRRLKRIESVIRGAADLELSVPVKTPIALTPSEKLEMYTTVEPLLRNHQSEVKGSLRCPKAKNRRHLHVPSSPKEATSPKSAASYLTLIQELRSSQSSLNIKNRSWMKSPSTSLTNLYQETQNRRRSLGLVGPKGVSLKFGHSSKPGTTVDTVESRSTTTGLPNIRSSRKPTKSKA
jgi:hypothetical protein